MENKLNLDIQYLPGRGYLATSGSDKKLKATGKSIAETIDMILSMTGSVKSPITDQD